MGFLFCFFFRDAALFLPFQLMRCGGGVLGGEEEYKWNIKLSLCGEMGATAWLGVSKPLWLHGLVCIQERGWKKKKKLEAIHCCDTSTLEVAMVRTCRNLCTDVSWGH